MDGRPGAAHARAPLTDTPATCPGDPEGASGGARRGAPMVAGFAAETSVFPGDTLDLRVTVDPPRPFRARLWRIGAAAGPVAEFPGQRGLAQPAPLIAGPTVSCHHWWSGWRLPVPGCWRPGVYLAELRTEDGGLGWVPFTVAARRPPADDALLLVVPDLSWQLGNAFPAASQSGVPLAPPSGLISFDRPFPGQGLPAPIERLHRVVRWAERVGTELGYAGSVDLHRGLVDPADYRGAVFPGPEVCWTLPLRRAVERARDAGTSLAFLSAGTGLWRVDLRASPAGVPDRMIAAVGSGRRAAQWRHRGEPEQPLLGVQFDRRVAAPAPLVVRNAGHWLWEGAELAEGAELPGVVAVAADRYSPRVPLPDHVERTLLAHSAYLAPDGRPSYQETSLYRAPAGGLVFCSGSSGWVGALAAAGPAGDAIRRATANLLDGMRKYGGAPAL